MATKSFGIDLILSTFSHEVRTPLTAMTGALNLLSDGNLGPVPEEQKGFIDLALRNARRLESLIAAILESGRAANGDWPVDPVPSRLERLVRGGVDEAVDHGQPSGARVDVTHAEGLPLVPADAEGVRRIVKNLVANALRFTPRTGAVRVHVDFAPEGVCVSVSDSGPGVPAEERDAIFDRFRQLPSALGGRPSGGLGLGLFLARRIAEAHGGTLRCVAPVDDTGARFELWLPVAVPTAKTPTAPWRLLRIVRTDGAPMRMTDTFRAAEALRSSVPAARRWERPEAVVAILPDGPPEELELARARITAALGDSLRLTVGSTDESVAA